MRPKRTPLQPTRSHSHTLATLLVALLLVACTPSPTPVLPMFGSEIALATPAGPPPSKPSPAPDLRAATYNILAAKRGIDGIESTLAAMDADVIALQEVDVNTRRFGRIDLPAELGRRLRMHHAFVPHRRYQGGEIGVALLSRHPIDNLQRASALGSELAMLTADVQTPMGALHVVVVHTHPTDPRDTPRRRMRFDRLRLAETRAAAELATDALPALVMGDFNATPGGPEYEAMEAVLVDACPRGGPTWPASFPVVQLDYIWTSRDVVGLDCQTPASSASDHRPRFVDLKLSRVDP